MSVYQALGMMAPLFGAIVALSISGALIVIAVRHIAIIIYVHSKYKTRSERELETARRL